MVMMLTAGLGVSEIMMGWDIIALEVGGVILLLLRNDAVDTPLHGFGKRGDVMGVNMEEQRGKAKSQTFSEPKFRNTALLYQPVPVLAPSGLHLLLLLLGPGLGCASINRV